jgi:hypothetical protein
MQKNARVNAAEKSAFLAKFKYSPSTAKSYMSGIRFYLKMNGVHDITDSFILKKMLKGMQRLEKRGDCRKPITLDLLLLLKVPEL